MDISNSLLGFKWKKGTAHILMFTWNTFVKLKTFLVWSSELLVNLTTERPQFLPPFSILMLPKSLQQIRKRGIYLCTGICYNKKPITTQPTIPTLLTSSAEIQKCWFFLLFVNLMVKAYLLLLKRVK